MCQQTAGNICTPAPLRPTPSPAPSSDGRSQRDTPRGHKFLPLSPSFLPLLPVCTFFESGPPALVRRRREFSSPLDSTYVFRESSDRPQLKYQISGLTAAGNPQLAKSRCQSEYTLEHEKAHCPWFSPLRGLCLRRNGQLDFLQSNALVLGNRS